MKITNIKFRKIFDAEPLKGICSVTFDDEFVLHDVKIISAKDKMLVVMPSRRNINDEYVDIAHPINSKFRNYIENELFREYRELTSSSTDV